MKDYLSKSIIFLGLVLLCIGAESATAQSQQIVAKLTAADALGDSLLRSYSIDELLTYKSYYDEERLRLEKERSVLREKGIRDLEAFVRSHPESRVLDKVIFRLADLYYEKANDDYHLSQERYSQTLELYDAGNLVELPKEPKKDYSRSLALYQSVLANFPQSKLLDDASYNIAYISEDLGKKEEANSLYEKFLQDFPDSRYVPEILMRQAEYYFNPPVNQIERAIDIYKKILAYTDNPRYDEALYRLGWSYYKLNDYPQAIAYFTELADDISQAKKSDPKSKISNPALAEESIEYIGISFLDFTGVEGAETYLKNIGGRDFGFSIIKKIGDSYMNVKEEYANAIKAYDAILRMYPYEKDTPMIQARVAEAYRLMENDEQAYLTRKALFDKYHDGTDWWLKVTDPEARNKTNQLAEHALRENINLLFERANDNKDQNLYAQAVDDSRAYLAVFPKDSNAVKIHWNMALALDAKLDLKGAAYDEYLEISNLYWGSKYQKEAAKNAIALAQDFVGSDSVKRSALLPLTIGEMREGAKADSTRLRQSLKLEPIPLTDGEVKLAGAIDNYIKLFPYDPETAARLSQSGSLYYNKNDFSNALKYFKTLLKHFPEDSSAEYAEFLIMESYFGKLDYKSVEIVSRRLKEKSTNSAYATKANQRLAESIFLQAESLADSAEHFKAAEEYRRVADEVPDAEFADLALFNAGLEFDRAHEYSRSVETYERLSSDYSKSSYYLPALNNMALDFGELKDFHNAAITFERLAEEDPDSAKAETHLFNASVFYVKSEDWERAIRANKKFVERYPDSPDADDLFYDIANYYLKLDDIDKANEVYGQYAEKFPDSPRVVETFYRRGEYYEKAGDLGTARMEYEKAIAKSDAFVKAQKDANEFFAGEALFRLTELKFTDYLKISFKLPLATMQENKQQKKNLLLDIVDSYTKVAAYGTMRLYESTYKIGLAYENFAETWARQDIPGADETKRIVAHKEINQTSAELYERAVEAYKNSVQVLERISGQYQVTFRDTTSASLQPGKKIVAVDSTLLVANRWIDRSKEKISEVVYDIAEINYASVKELLDAPRPPGMDKITHLEYRNQLLAKFIRPLTDEIVENHIRNLKEAQGLGLENKWVSFSRNKIISTNNIIADEYASLAWTAFNDYGERLQDYVKTLPTDDVMALSISDEMANYIDFGRAFARATIDAYKLTTDKAIAESINNIELVHTEKKLVEFVYTLAQKVDSLAKVANLQRKDYEEKFRETKESMYEDGLFALEDNYFSFSEANKEILGKGYEIAQQLQIDNEYKEKILLALVRSEPEKYAGALGLEVAEIQFVSDASWLASPDYQDGWMSLGFVDSSWSHPNMVTPSEAFSGYSAKRIWLSATDDRSADLTIQQDGADTSTAAVDTSRLAASDSTLEKNVRDDDNVVNQPVDSAMAVVAEKAISTPVQSVFFRKPLNVDGLPVAAQIQIVSPGAYKLFVNGEFISEIKNLTNGEAPQIHNFSEFMQEGKNVIALHAENNTGTSTGVEAVIFLKNIPGWDKRQTEIRIQKEKEQENLLFDKGILVKRP